MERDPGAFPTPPPAGRLLKLRLTIIAMAMLVGLGVFAGFRLMIPKVPAVSQTTPPPEVSGSPDSGHTATSDQTPGPTTVPEASPAASPIATPTVTAPPPATPPAATTKPTATPARVPQTYTMSFTGSGYSPVNITIKAGDIIRFVNNSNNKDMWPASDDHPTHTLYAEFDAGQPYGPGTAYSFTFNNKGSWGYHDHLKPSATGTITVQ